MITRFPTLPPTPYQVGQPVFGSILGIGKKKKQSPDLFKNDHSDQALEKLKEPLRSAVRIILDDDMAIQKYDGITMLEIFKAVGKAVQLKRKSYRQKHTLQQAFNKIRAPLTPHELPIQADIQKMLREQAVSDPKQKDKAKKNLISDQAMFGALEDLKNNRYLDFKHGERIQLTTLGWFIFSEIGDLIDPIRFTPSQLKGLRVELAKKPDVKAKQPDPKTKAPTPQPPGPASAKPEEKAEPRPPEIETKEEDSKPLPATPEQTEAATQTNKKD